MRVGLCFDGFYSIQEMIELAQLADDIGMDSIWMSDHLCFRDSHDDVDGVARFD